MTRIYLKNIYFIILLVFNFSLIQSTWGASPDIYEPDNSAATAKVIVAGTVQNHSISPGGDVDWYKFTLTATEYGLIRISASSSMNISLYDSFLQLVSDGSFIYTSAFKLDPGTYYIKVSKSFDVDYTISLTTSLSDGDIYEPDNQVSDATIITPGIPQQHNTAPNGDVDWYKFTLTATEYGLIRISASSSMNISLYDSFLQLVSGNTYIYTHNFKLDPGTYYIKVSKNVDLDYTIKLETTKSNGDAFEVDNQTSDATVITKTTPQLHTIFPSGDYDWYKFTLTATDAIKITASNLNPYIYLYNNSLSLISNSYGTLNRTLSAGTYYIRIHDPSTGNYTFQIIAKHLKAANGSNGGNGGTQNNIIPILNLLLFD